ncbi:MAG: SPOR domain-containing protein [bacterium]|nr:SPOR domain-containing protein [bacterium]
MLKTIRFHRVLLPTAFVGCLVISACDTFDENSLAEKASSAEVSDPIEKEDSIQILNGTFLGNDQRNYYGDSIGNDLTELWKLHLGTGVTNLADGPVEWSGAGWTGQPLIVREHNKKFLLLGCYDHNLKKIDASSGELVWSYAYDDVIKGTGSIWDNPKAETPEDRLVVLQGSRLGNQNSLSAPSVYSYRAVSYMTGKELWRMNSKRSSSYSRDVDASAITINDTAYIGLENGSFISFGPGKEYLKPIASTAYYEPSVFQELPLYEKEDVWNHGGNLVTEASPARIGDRIYIASGSGHVYGYNLKTKTIDWTFDIGSDLDGSPVVTSDGCLLITVEKQYISGKGGVFKLDPSKSPEESVVWYFPTGDREFADWKGGVIGSVAINDSYNDGQYPSMAVFTGIDGTMYLVDHQSIDPNKTCPGPNNKHTYPMPKLLDQRKIGPSISTPIFVRNKIVAAGYHGLHLFTVNDQGEIVSDVKRNGVFEASPVADRGNIYIASRNGYLYCLGSESTDNSESIEDVKPEVNIAKKAKPKTVEKNSVSKKVVKPVEKKLTQVVDSKLASSKSLQKGHYYIVVGAFGVKDNAVNEVERFRSKGINAFMAPGPNGMNYVIVGESDSEDSLSTVRSTLKKKYNVEGWVYRK